MYPKSAWARKGQLVYVKSREIWLQVFSETGNQQFFDLGSGSIAEYRRAL